MPAAAATTRDEELHWLALALIPGLGSRKTVDLIQRFQTPCAVFRASLTELEGVGLSAQAAQSISSGCTFDDAVTQHQKMLDAGAALVPFTAEAYPQRLREIYDPPAVLFTRGRVELLDRVMVAVVGTRHPTPYGAAAAERLATDLAAAGVVIASGMARGIDTAAHRAAFAANGDTVAVFGCGVDVVYPAENRRLADEIARKGLLVSEYPMGTPAYPQNFPVRNRIVSGLSAGVLVVEGAQYSGSGITARLALDQGREVFAVPGNITSKMSYGPNLLIKQGAELIQDAQDILDHLPQTDRIRLAANAPETPRNGELTLVPASEVARQLLSLLRPGEPTHIDELLGNLPQYSSSEVVAALFDLELSGGVRQLPGKQFVKTF